MDPTSHQSLTNSTQRRLGEHLQAAGLLNSEQLDEAIEYQCIYGGKLGTSLIELGLIDEDQLAKVLSKQLQLHHIKPDLLMNVSVSVLKLIPEKTALKYQIVPYYEDGKKLYIAMNEARDLTLIDELSFQLDRIIIPLAVPEVRLLLALQKHYGMVLSPRFETLAKQMDRRSLAAQKKKSKQQTSTETDSKPTETTDPETPDKNVATWPLLGDENYSGEEPTDDNYFASKSAATVETQVSLLQQLADAKERDDIAVAIIDHLKKDFPVCALLMVRANLATGWLASNDKATQNFAQINIPIQESSVFHLVATSHSPYLGSVADSVQNRKILDYFSSSPQVNALILPIQVRNRLVSILYIQGELEELEHRLVEIQRIVNKAEMSFQLLIMRNKILTV
ncbi:MAG: hypothetical protein L3J57_02910 [Desulfuromusa sp.]|nr:hypothetical protein [Desulfuromusa sp.]